MKTNYKKFMKHAEKMVRGVPKGRRDVRPALNGIYHSDKDVFVTDSHHLFAARNVNAPRNVLLDAITGEELDHSYPNVEHLILKKEDAREQTYIMDVPGKVELLKAMQTAGAISQDTKKKEVEVNLKGNKISLDKPTAIFFEFSLSPDINASSVPIEETLFNSEYLLNSLDMFSDMGHQNVTLYWYGKHKPFMLTSKKNELQVIILPMRRH